MRDRFAGSVTGRGFGFGVGNHLEGNEAVLRSQIGAAASEWSRSGLVHGVVSQTDELFVADEEARSWLGCTRCRSAVNGLGDAGG